MFSNEKEPIVTVCDLDQSPENYATQRKPIPKGYVWNASIHIIFLKWQTYRNGGQISGCRVKPMGGDWAWLRKGSTEGSDGDGKVLDLVCISIRILFVLWVCKTLPLGKRYVTSLYYFMQLHGNLQFSFIKKFNNHFFKLSKKLASLNTMSMISSKPIQLQLICHVPVVLSSSERIRVSFWRWSGCLSDKCHTR